MKASYMSPQEALKAIRQQLANPLEPIPDGYMDAKQYGAEWKCTSTHAGRLLKASHEKGLADMITLKRQRGRSVAFYRFGKPKK